MATSSGFRQHFSRKKIGHRPCTICGHPDRFTSDFDRCRAGYSPDRLDALVWAISHLMVKTYDTGVVACGPIIVRGPPLGSLFSHPGW
jgi:hypothetical protein